MMLKNGFDTSNYDKNDKRPLPIGKKKCQVFLKMNWEEK